MPEKIESGIKRSVRKFFTAIGVFVFVIFLIGVLFPSVSSGNVALIKISGPIVTSSDDGFFSQGLVSSDNIVNLLKKADESSSIKAILFEINSPGGSAVASEEIALQIQKTKKPTAAYIRDIGASGGYWIASATDQVFVNRMSLTGSIGVIASYLEFSGFINDFNVTYERLVAGKYKDMGSPFRKLSNDERVQFQGKLDQIHNYFIKNVADNRKLKTNYVRNLSEGNIYTGLEAVNLGLADSIGSKDDAIAYLESKIEDTAEISEYGSKRSFLQNLAVSFDRSFYLIGKGIGSSLFSADSNQKPGIFT